MSKPASPSPSSRPLGKLVERAQALFGSVGEHMFARFTDRARSVLALAQEEAQQLDHRYVGTEHLLLGLIRVREGIAAKALENLGVGLDHTRQAVEAAVGRGEMGAEGDMTFTPRLKQVLEFATDEAQRLKHTYVGTEHLLLGLIREDEGVGFQVLASSGITAEAVRRQINRLLKKDNVVTCRVSDQDAEAIDKLVETGICSSRSDAASWLIRAGIEANDALFKKVEGTIEEIRRLREEAQATARQLGRDSQPETEPPA